MKDIRDNIQNKDLSKIIDQVCLMNNCQLTTLINAIALLISDNRTTDEIYVIKDFISAISSNLSIIARKQSVCADKKNGEEIDNIKKKIVRLENHNNHE